MTVFRKMGACWVQQGDRGMVRMISFLLWENETATVVLKTPENINDIHIHVLGKTMQQACTTRLW